MCAAEPGWELLRPLSCRGVVGAGSATTRGLDFPTARQSPDPTTGGKLVSKGPFLHHHSHDTGKVLCWSLLLTLIFVIVEIAAGIHARSLALLSDAGHNFTDSLALVLAWFGVYYERKPPNEIKTYGYHRAGVLAAFVNALSLLLLAAYILWQSYQRWWHPAKVAETTMLIVACFGVIVNAAIMWGLHHERKFDLNVRGAWVHMLGDVLGSLAIIGGAIAIHYTGMQRIDPLLSALIGLLIIWTAWDIMLESLNILLEGLPRGLEFNDVTAAMRDTEDVIDVHDVHIWSLGSSTHALSCHVLIEDIPPSESEAVLRRLNGVLAERFGIRHTTVQFEHVRCPGCPIENHDHEHHAHHEEH